MVIIRTRAGRVAAEKDLGAVLLERVVKLVEDLGGHEVPRHEHIRPLKRLGRHHPLSLSHKEERGEMVWIQEGKMKGRF